MATSATSRPSGDSAITAKHDQFRHARLKLTFFYSLGFAVALALFSSVTYFYFSQTFSYEFHSEEEELFEQEPRQALEEHLTEQAAEYLMRVLVETDVILALLMIIASYIIAGRTLAPIERAYERQRAFVANAAHDLRTPLTVMKSGIELSLTGERKPEEYRSFLSDSLEEVDTMTDMTNDLLFLAHSDAGSVTLRETVDLSVLVARQVDYMRAYATHHGVTLTDNVAPGCMCRGSRSDLKRMISNLIKNGVEYNTQGGAVRITLARKGHNATLRIEDAGAGISSEHLPHVFERFYKVDPSRTKRSGSGLGLAIVHEIVMSHKGHITIDSAVGKGTTVTSTLPISS